MPLGRPLSRTCLLASKIKARSRKDKLVEYLASRNLGETRRCHRHVSDRWVTLI
jgi:hypothetical protein